MPSRDILWRLPHTTMARWLLLVWLLAVPVHCADLLSRLADQPLDYVPDHFQSLDTDSPLDYVRQSVLPVKQPVPPTSHHSVPSTTHPSVPSTDQPVLPAYESVPSTDARTQPVPDYGAWRRDLERWTSAPPPMPSQPADGAAAADSSTQPPPHVTSNAPSPPDASQPTPHAQPPTHVSQPQPPASSLRSDHALHQGQASGGISLKSLNLRSRKMKPGKCKPGQKCKKLKYVLRVRKMHPQQMDESVAGRTPVGVGVRMAVRRQLVQGGSGVYQGTVIAVADTPADHGYAHLPCFPQRWFHLWFDDFTEEWVFLHVPRLVYGAGSGDAASATVQLTTGDLAAAPDLGLGAVGGALNCSASPAAFPHFSAFRVNRLQPPLTDDSRGAKLAQSFFAWLRMPPSAYWVNLNPVEPDRILDDQLAATMIGRVLLSSDFQLKNLTAWSMHPDAASGRSFWQALALPFPTPELCLHFRTWITSAAGQHQVELVEMGDYLYVTQADLAVHEESDYLSLLDSLAATGDASWSRVRERDQAGCHVGSPETQRASEMHFKRVLLPAIQQAVRTSPRFEQLRFLYYWRVVAEWYQRLPTEEQVALGLLQADPPAEHSNPPHAFQPTDYQAWTPHSGMLYRDFVYGKYRQQIQDGAYNVRKIYAGPPPEPGQERKYFARTYVHGGILLP